MKVFVGPYRNWIGPYQIADFFLKPFVKDEDKRHAAGEWLSKTFVNSLCKIIDKNKKRKIDIKIHEYDAWNLDHTLALIIHPALIKLKEQNHGSGNVDDCDVPDQLKRSAAPPVKNEWDTDELFFQRWDYIMDELIWTFGELANDDSAKVGKDYEDREARINNGLRLFGRYYRGLWD